jgi:hypothetical protein
MNSIYKGVVKKLTVTHELSSVQVKSKLPGAHEELEEPREGKHVPRMAAHAYDPNVHRYHISGWAILEND